MAISSGTILKVVVSLLMPDSVIAQNIFYTVITDLVTSDAEDDVVDDMIIWVEAMYTDLIGNLSDQMAGSDVKVYEYDPIDEDWDEVGSNTWSVTFTGTGDMIPHGVAAICYAKTLDPDVQAGKYIPGITEDSFSESDLNAGLVTDLAQFCATWVGGFTGTNTGGTVGPGVWSTVGAVFKLFNGNYVINGLAGYQRRRKPGVGI